MRALTADAILAELSPELPLGARKALEGLAWKLGVAKERGSGWNDYVGLEPCLDLPSFAACGAEVAPGRLAAFQRAHWHGGFHWLLADRIADGQAGSGAQEAKRAADAFGRLWREALAEAMGSRAAADGAVKSTRARVKRAVRAEQRALRRGALSPRQYAAIVDDKLCWLRLSAVELVAKTSGPERARQFARAAGLFCASLQALDDAVDEKDDAARFGSGYAGALGVTVEALSFAAAGLSDTGAAEARAGGFERFAHWLDQRAAEVRRALGEVSFKDRLAGAVLHAAISHHWSSVPSKEAQHAA